MRLVDERAAVVRLGQCLGRDGLSVGTSGNMSVRRGDLIAITPSGLRYEEMQAIDVVMVTPDGTVVDEGQTPSSELPMHLAIYRSTDAGAIVHTHSPYATALSTLTQELPPIHYLIVLLGTHVRTAPYDTPGTEALATKVVAALGGSSACLLQNHGAVTVADSLERAYTRAVVLEWLCSLYSRARLLGEPRLLSAEELARAAEALQNYRT